jgi:hypothetical protein
MDEMGVCDLELVEFQPTWRNLRMGDERIQKRLGRFILFCFVFYVNRVRTWVGNGGISNIFPILVQLLKDDSNFPSPFKVNPEWL